MNERTNERIGRVLGVSADRMDLLPVEPNPRRGRTPSSKSSNKYISGMGYPIHFYYPRDAMLARVIEIATCLSVRLSVTRRYCVKTKNASGMISSPSGSPKTLVF